MAQLYKQKDLGYQRTATDAMFRVEMEDNTLWDVPVQVIADSRDENYRDDKEDTVGSIRSGGLNDSEIYDWAGNNMNWDEVAAFAVPVPASKQKKIDWQEGWSNGEKKIVGKI